MRKDLLRSGYLYHICSKSIAGYNIFRSEEDYSRFIEMIRYYAFERPPVKFSIYQKLSLTENIDLFKELGNRSRVVDIIAYCIMPTHIHLLLAQLMDNGISIFMKNLLNSYTRYFNIKNKRKGPLWQGRFRSILIETDEQLLHLTRYIHLNPTSNDLVERPEEWIYSSYKEYVSKRGGSICNFRRYIEMKTGVYKKFVETQRDYQKKLAEIKHLLLE